MTDMASHAPSEICSEISQNEAEDNFKVRNSRSMRQTRPNGRNKCFAPRSSRAGHTLHHGKRKKKHAHFFANEKDIPGAAARTFICHSYTVSNNKDNR
jgi:hypothetical protein